MDESKKRKLTMCFNMPTSNTVTGRVTSVNSAFANAITPSIKPSPEEIEEVLNLLGMDVATIQCVYCGNPKTEWDHLLPSIGSGTPTGYPTSIKNLVPSCGKCNQSKGKADWKKWMLGSAPQSPRTRGIANLDDRVAHLEKYEKWANCAPVKYRDFVDTELWQRYYALRDEIVAKMQEAQRLVPAIASQIAQGIVRIDKESTNVTK